MPKPTIEQYRMAANTLRGLSMDGVQAAKSGHPGMPMGMADVAAVLWLSHLKVAPEIADWPDRDRFVLSAGHGSMLLYSLLHLGGYDLPLDELKRFRQLDSQTPGHPEAGHTPGVETTTGPLGQGIANAVGMALAERMLAGRLNTGDFTAVDHHTYAICGDGDLMEGISHEACALAGHLKLEKLVLLYDSNQITIEGKTDLAYSDDVRKRFLAYGWQVLETNAHDFAQIERALRKARKGSGKPVMVICHSRIGYGSPNKAGSAEVHGAPLGEEEVKLSKRNLGLPEDKTFFVPEEVSQLFAARARKNNRLARRWQRQLKAFLGENQDWRRLWQSFSDNLLPENLNQLLPEFDPEQPMATRAASGKTIQSLAAALPWLVGGSADLAPSTLTLIDGAGSVAPGDYSGRNLHFGVRELGMAGLLNGMALHGGFRVYGATFFVFLDYCRASVRLSAIMGLPVIYVFTHDSFYVGEDGPTHEPVEQIASLRCIPNMTVIRPADPTETAAAWVAALKNRRGPTALLLTRQNLPVIDRRQYPEASQLERGAYILWQSGQGTPDLIVLASGSEVALALSAARQAETGNIRVVSMPSWELFESQPQSYRDSVLDPDCPSRLAVEAGSPLGWERHVGERGAIIGMSDFGLSGPYKDLEQRFGFTVSNILEQINRLLNHGNGKKVEI